MPGGVFDVGDLVAKVARPAVSHGRRKTHPVCPFSADMLAL
jgi:hypothetical protein